MDNSFDHLFSTTTNTTSPLASSTRISQLPPSNDLLGFDPVAASAQTSLNQSQKVEVKESGPVSALPHLNIERIDADRVNTVINGLKKIYAAKIKPVESTYSFDKFNSQLLRDSDFDAKPMVLLLGQYSTGKSSFVQYLLGKNYPGLHIGPEPTTDRFVAVMHGDEEMIIPGNALAIQSDKPFTALSRFGNDFLTKFQGSQTNSPILKDITLIDSPGVLSGEKQTLGRSYDFTKVCEWFAERSDMVILFFDAHKLDISDEFKRVIESLKGNADKIRVVLNKADCVSGQQLLRVYGALMWYLGKVMQTPEVVRVYVGSFWSNPYQNKDNEKLFDAEREDLFKDLFSLPKYAALRKVNELVKRARLAKVHAYIISHFAGEMPSFFYKDKKKEELIANLKNEFFKVHQKWQLPVGDFPNIEKFKEMLKVSDFNSFQKLNQKLIESMDSVLAEDIPKLLKQFPEKSQKEGGNPFESTNPFDTDIPSQMSGDPLDALVSPEERVKYRNQFAQLTNGQGKLTGKQASEIMYQSNLPREVLSKIWALSDIDKDGALSDHEFMVSMYLINNSLKGNAVPATVPEPLLKPKSNSPF